MTALHIRPCSPFGIYLLHTDGGSLVCDDADEAAQMLFLTLQRLSNAIDARPWYVVSEHMMPRYETAVAAYLADAEAEPKKWSALTYEARSMYELGVVMALNDQSKELQEILRCGRGGNVDEHLSGACACTYTHLCEADSRDACARPLLHVHGHLSKAIRGVGNLPAVLTGC